MFYWKARMDHLIMWQSFIFFLYQARDYNSFDPLIPYRDSPF